MFKILFDLFNRVGSDIQGDIENEITTRGKPYPLRKARDLSIEQYLSIINSIPALKEIVEMSDTIPFDSNGNDKAEILKLQEKRLPIETLGSGIQNFSKIPKYGKFGKYNIDLKKLYGKGVLSMRSSTGN